jgi:23S rRNA pseudouridine1911/1915/1917 synthase
VPRTGWGWEITPEELRTWILHEDEDLLVVNKPPHVLCHPSKHGPWSSLVGACREYLEIDRLHMPSRLDRETSGVVVLARNAELASRLQRTISKRNVKKVYHAMLTGELSQAVLVDQPIGKALASAVIVKRGVRPDGQSAQTLFTPIRTGGGYTLAQAEPVTGRLHQIRVHAAWLGHAVIGDKIYGPDESLFLDFLEQGWTARHQSMLGMDHQALHASEWICPNPPLHFTAPLPADWTSLLSLVTVEHRVTAG